MKYFFYTFVFIVSFSNTLFAQNFEQAEKEMYSCLERNFQACNNENVEELLDTCSLDMPRREEFRHESVKLWREKDIYYRLVRFKLLKIEGNYAVAEVVQLTHVEDRNSSNEREEFIRNGTTLLTRDECTKYRVAFKRDNGSWKCYLTITEPVKCDLNE